MNNKIELILNNSKVNNWINEKLTNQKEINLFRKNILTIYNNNPNLFDKEKINLMSVLSACVKAMLLDLPLDPNLGYAYIVPYNGKGQLQIGYKGYIQLAIRTGKYLTINAIEVKQGELLNFDELEQEYNFKWITNENERTKKETIGYVAFFKLLNGYKKTLYWSKEKCENHFKTYSKNYQTYGKFTAGSYEGMALKTVLTQLLRKWGIMSVEMQEAYQHDQAIIINNSKEFSDNPNIKNKEDNNVIELNNKKDELNLNLEQEFSSNEINDDEEIAKTVDEMFSD
ncbi:recombinase RecT [Spiroplasma citri]|uniref:Recombinase RecT n=1 Tax=Spiroplasma citri TaxID=2133 RepID=A0AAX3SX28_SPICI|nr:recombinase RecT [Spiroplasma citri]WFG95682.1 recombinase RecT [Spiroplasma citri]